MKNPLTFHKTVLSNGLTVIGEHNPLAQSFAAGYFANTGSRDEQPEVAGVSHFLEHMMFKGTSRRTAEDVNLEFDALGANYNAYTNDERTVYYGAVLAERSAKLLDLLSDMMRPALRQDDFDSEKNVILEEIAMYEDRPQFKVFELATERYFNGHPLGNSVLGTTDSIKALTREQMLAYFNARYAPNNLLLAVAGNYDWDAVITQVEDLTASWQQAKTTRVYPQVCAKEGDESLQDTKVKRAHVAVFAPGVSAQDPLRYAASILANVIGDSSGSRLYWALVDKGLVDSAGLSHSSNDGAGSFTGYVSSGPQDIKKVLGIYHQVLQDVQTNGVTQEEWQRAQRKLATSLTLRGETPFGRLMSFGTSYLYTHTYQSVADVVNAVFNSSVEDALVLLQRKPFSKAYSFTLSSESV